MVQRGQNPMDYKVLYATLAGRVDETVSYLEHMTEQQTFDWFHVACVMDMLKSALLEAEEYYINSTETEPDTPLIILPPRH